jgi:hypothetical protein
LPKYAFYVNDSSARSLFPSVRCPFKPSCAMIVVRNSFQAVVSVIVCMLHFIVGFLAVLLTWGVASLRSARFGVRHGPPKFAVEPC